MDGTTDITRTYPLGELTEDERKFYTWTLQCHIDIAKAVWLNSVSYTHLPPQRPPCPASAGFFVWLCPAYLLLE